MGALDARGAPAALGALAALVVPSGATGERHTGGYKNNKVIKQQ